MKQAFPPIQPPPSAPSSPQTQLPAEEAVAPLTRPRGWKRAWREFQNFLLMLIGVILAALGYALFQIPSSFIILIVLGDKYAHKLEHP
jgi:hypothetical protein